MIAAYDFTRCWVKVLPWVSWVRASPSLPLVETNSCALAL